MIITNYIKEYVTLMTSIDFKIKHYIKMTKQEMILGCYIDTAHKDITQLHRGDRTVFDFDY